MNGHSLLNSLLVMSTNDCCTLLLTCLEKAFRVGSATFTTKNFKYAVCLKKFSLQKCFLCMGGSPGDVSENPVTWEKRKKGWRMSCDVGEATEGLENEL